MSILISFTSVLIAATAALCAPLSPEDIRAARQIQLDLIRDRSCQDRLLVDSRRAWFHRLGAGAAPYRKMSDLNLGRVEVQRVLDGAHFQTPGAPAVLMTGHSASIRSQYLNHLHEYLNQESRPSTFVRVTMGRTSDPDALLKDDFFAIHDGRRNPFVQYQHTLRQPRRQAMVNAQVVDAIATAEGLPAPRDVLLDLDIAGAANDVHKTLELLHRAADAQLNFGARVVVAIDAADVAALEAEVSARAFAKMMARFLRIDLDQTRDFKLIELLEAKFPGRSQDLMDHLR